MTGGNWGIIGPGNIAKEFIADLPYAAKNQTVTAVLGRKMESVNAFADEHYIRGRYTSINEFVEKGKPGLVYIATPHPLHYGEAKFCLQHKIPVLCEKPLCLNAAECEDLVRTAKENNTFLMEGMWIRFLPFICKAQMLINENLLGDLLTVFASMNYKAPYDPGSRYFNPALGGGSLLDLGAYPVFLSALFLGKPEQICASATLTDQGVDKICSAILKYNSGAHAIIESSLIKNSDMPALITGTRGWMKIVHPWFEKSPGLQVELYTGEKYNFPFSWEGHGLHFEIREMLDCLDQGKVESSRMPHNFSLVTAAIMDEIRKQTGVRYETAE